MQKTITKSKRPPEIYVLGINEPGYFSGPRYCKAHLCFKKGFLYLQWKDNGKVRSFYLRKTENVSTTAQAAAAPIAGAGRRRSGRRANRAKVREKASRTRKRTKG